MKSNLTKLSLALLSAVFILGCQDVGTGVVASDGPGPQFVKKGIVCAEQNHASCPRSGDTPVFAVTLDEKPDGTKAVFFVDLLGNPIVTPVETTDSDDRAIFLNGVTLDLSFFNGPNLSCPLGEPLGEETGTLKLSEGAAIGGGHPFLSFQFRHSGIKQKLSMNATIADLTNWPPALGTGNTMTEDGGGWFASASGKNNRNGCTGSGGARGDLVFTVTIFNATGGV